jgi:hypothetical protein
MRTAARLLSFLLIGAAIACASSRSDWQLLGRKTVSFLVERDTIDVDRREGRFRQIMFVVEGAPVEMRDVRVTFGDGYSFHPETRLEFGRDTRSRAIDLPGGDRYIRKIDFVYRKTSGIFRRATVSVYGR